MLECDVLIVGAGPAGSAAGSWLARKGWKVLCVEAVTFPRYQIGESLLPRTGDLLEEAGLLASVVERRYQPKPGAVFLRGDERERYSFADVFPGQRTSTFQVPRGDFDQTLSTAARKAGVDLRFLHRVESIEFAAEFADAKVRDLESGLLLDVRSRFVLDCSGYGRVLPKLLGLNRAPTLTPRAALFTMVEGDSRPEGDAAGDIWVGLHPRGAWTWVIPFSDGRTSVGVVAENGLLEAPAGSCDRDQLMSLLREDSNLHDRLGSARPVLKVMRLAAWTSAVDRFHGPRWAVTGNAGEFLDPVFSSGVTLALESAVLASKLVDRELRGDAVAWDSEYDAAVAQATHVFRVFVESWYQNELPRVLLARDKAPEVKRAITAVLGGYVRDPKNPFVRDARGTLGALLRML